MASVWKRLQRVNKRAAKFQYTASYHRIDLETSVKWKPNKLSVVWTRRSRRVITDPLDWEPSLKDPLKGSVIYPVPENHTVAVTLFKDSRTNELEDKDWTFVLEDVSHTGKRRRLAVTALNMRKYASLEPTQRPLTLTLEPTTRKIVSASVQLTLHCVLLREGQATDEDMQSLASLLSVNNNSDIAVLEDLDEDDYSMSDNSTRQMFDLRQQMEEMTHSLTTSDIATPNSVQSLNFDNSRTPTAPITPCTPIPEDERETTPKISEFDLRIETPNKPKSRPEILSTLTRLVKKTETPSAYTNKIVTSTPNKANEPPAKADGVIKGVVFKTKHLSKHNLKPLELKTNLNSITMDYDVEQNTPSEDKTSLAKPDKIFSTNFDRDKTPVQDLLDWCKEITMEYRQCRVTNLTTSWRNGLAFCAIIHHFRPDLIDFSGLQPDDPEHNLRIAFEASSRIGISQVLTAADICSKPVPDRLAIMTYLFQLRAHFTGNELQVEQLGNDPNESSYLVGRHDTDGSLPEELFSREISMRRSRNLAGKPRPVSQESSDSRNSQERAMSPEKKQSPTAMKDVRDIFFAQSKNILGKMLSPTRDKPISEKADSRHVKEGSVERNSSTRWFTDPINEPILVRPEKLMTRKELTDPFGSDEEEEPPPTQNVANNPELKSQVTEGDTEIISPVTQTSMDLPKPTPQLLSRHDELKERARQLLEATKREAREKERINITEEKEANRIESMVNGGLRNGETNPKKICEDERQAQLRERARRLIAEARAGIVSPTSPTSPSRIPHGGTVEIISRQSVLDEIAAAGGVENVLGRRDSDRSTVSPDRLGKDIGSDCRSKSPSPENDSGSIVGGSPLHSFSALVERLTPDGQLDDLNESTDGMSYIQSELEALEREQASVDEEAAQLEKQLRRVMESADNTEEEDKLMSQWFNLVNKKNALLRRQMQLNILEQEEDLSRKCALLARELRLYLGIDEWRKTSGQKRRERLLLHELLTAVNERDRLVREMDEQEKAIADDDEIERNLSQVEIQRKNNCILQ